MEVQSWRQASRVAGLPVSWLTRQASLLRSELFSLLFLCPLLCCLDDLGQTTAHGTQTRA